jgi:2-polyprenyl-3-methyl-5-hydroxy-6-metoxy-1,4-benzoquinol methylase
MDAVESTLSTIMEKENYGSRAWIESQYASSEDDPWGLDWRPSQKYRYVRMVNALKSALGAHAGSRAIVDVGCATGTFTAMLSGLNGGAGTSQVVGADIAQSAVSRAAARFPQLKFECLALDECARKYAGKADIVTCMEVLYYLPKEQRAEAMRQLKSMLKPGGLLLVSSMVSSPPYFSLDELKALVAKELTIVGSDVLFLKPIALYEKLLMKLCGRSARKWMHVSQTAAGRLAAFFGRVTPRLSQSHGYVIARHD